MSTQQQQVQVDENLTERSLNELNAGNSDEVADGKDSCKAIEFN
jgi:hypothetical protein